MNEKSAQFALIFVLVFWEKEKVWLLLCHIHQM